MIEGQRCLLSGTLVYTPNKWVKIDDLNVNDYIINHHGDKVLIEMIGKWPVYWENRRFCDKVYKIPGGLYGCTKDTFISSFHKISHGEMVEVFKLGLELAKKEEVADNGRYILYHLKLKDDDINHFIVNGGCVVESWHGDIW
jgi:hypothetical protein